MTRYDMARFRFEMLFPVYAGLRAALSSSSWYMCVGKVGILSGAVAEVRDECNGCTDIHTDTAVWRLDCLGMRMDRYGCMVF